MRKNLPPAEKIKSAKNAINQILKMKGVDVSHKKRLLSEMIWHITESHGKYSTDYISEGIKKIKERMGYIPRKEVIHEHIYRRKILIENLLNKPNDSENILKNALACLVTKSEDKKLHQIDKIKNIDGFKRYNKANVKYYKNR